MGIDDFCFSDNWVSIAKNFCQEIKKSNQQLDNTMWKRRKLWLLFRKTLAQYRFRFVHPDPESSVQLLTALAWWIQFSRKKMYLSKVFLSKVSMFLWAAVFKVLVKIWHHESLIKMDSCDIWVCFVIRNCPCQELCFNAEKSSILLSETLVDSDLIVAGVDMLLSGPS